MSLNDDISWDLLRRLVRELAGQSAELAESRPLSGGMINNTLLLTANTGDRFVLKISPHRVNRDFSREAHQLGILRDLGLPVPRVLSVNIASLDNPDSYLILEHLPGVTLHHAKEQAAPEEYDRLQHELADLVVQLHCNTAEAYGRVTDGATRTFGTWVDFYRHVYDPIIAVLDTVPQLAGKPIKLIHRVHERLDRLIDHSDRPRLVHWDIWATNLLAAPDGDGHWHITALLDPMCKYAHHEAEIAYIDLFHTGTKEFRRTYQQQFKLSDDYHRLRKPVYQLYPLLNHVQLFGQQYLKPLHEALDRVSALV